MRTIPRLRTAELSLTSLYRLGDENKVETAFADEHSLSRLHTER